MNDAKIGERYFAIRDRLYSLISQIDSLAKVCHTPISESLTIDQASQELDAPLRILVCGEVNAGKSTLINLICGEPLCEVLQLPTTHKIYDYQYFPVARVPQVEPHYELIQRPSTILKRINPIDTPGTNATSREHLPQMIELSHSVDLILLVLPVSNPWGASAWNFVSDLPPETLSKLACVVMFSDVSLSQDSKVIFTHLADLAQKKMGVVPPFFSIYPSKVIEANESKVVNSALLAESGLPALSDFITHNVCSSVERRKIMRAWCARATSALRLIEKKLESRHQKLTQQQSFLHTVDSEIDQIGQAFIRKLPEHLEDVADVFQQEAAKVGKTLNRRLGFIPSFYRVMMGDRVSHEMERLFISRLEGAINQVAERDSIEIMNSCLDHWRNLSHRIEEFLDIHDLPHAQTEAAMDHSRQHFMSQLSEAATINLNQLSVRNALTKNIYMRNQALKNYLTITLILVILAATLGIADVLYIPYAFLVLAGGFFLTGTWMAIVTRKSNVADFNYRLLNTCGKFAAALKSEYELAMTHSLRDYKSCMVDFHQYIAKEGDLIKPHLQQQRQLFLLLKTLEQEL